jgi:hypothetical protein
MAVLDPFAANSMVGTRRNDLNPDTWAQDHLSADEWLEIVAHEGVLYDVVLLEPPYSARQVLECYRGFGRSVFQADTQQQFITRVRNKVAHLMTPTGVVISFGWDSTGMGIKRGFEIVEILLVSHGRNHHDTIVTVERRRRLRK